MSQPDRRRWHTQLQQMRDLLESAWPAILDTARQPFPSATWIASLGVVTGPDGGYLARTRRLGAGEAIRRARRPDQADRAGSRACGCRRGDSWLCGGLSG